jgi:Tfp pilus assembly protein PilF
MLCSAPGQREREIRKGAKFFEKAGVDMLGANAATALTGAGICYKKIGQRATAELRLIEALKYSPRYPAALLELADLYHKNDKIAAAKTKLRSYFSVTSIPSVFAKKLAMQLGMRL